MINVDPEGPRTFPKYLRATEEILRQDGFSVTTDEVAMDVYVSTD